MQTFLGEAVHRPYQQTALEAYGLRTRLWSGCSSLQTPLSRTQGTQFRRQLIKLLLDRVSARREISDEVATALNEDRGVLGLVVAGTPVDYPDLLPQQAWHHYVHVRKAASGDAVRRLQFTETVDPDADELLYQLATHLGSGTESWEDALDRFLGEVQSDERLILSLEWRVPECPKEREALPWREQCLDAWLRFATETLAGYHKQGLLIVNILLVEVVESSEAEAWCNEARALYRDRRRTLSETGRRTQHLSKNWSHSSAAAAHPDGRHDLLERASRDAGQSPHGTCKTLVVDGLLADAGTDTAQTQFVVPVIGLIVVPVRRAQVVGRVLERAAADHLPPGGFRSRSLILPHPGCVANQHSPLLSFRQGSRNPAAMDGNFFRSLGTWLFQP